MKKLMAVILACMMVLSLAACQTTTSVVIEKDGTGVLTGRLYMEADEEDLADFEPKSDGATSMFLEEKDGKQYIVTETVQTFNTEEELAEALNSSSDSAEGSAEATEEAAAATEEGEETPAAMSSTYTVESFNQGGKHCIRISYITETSAEQSEEGEEGSEDPAGGEEAPAEESEDLLADVFMTLTLKAPLGAAAFGTENFTTAEDGSVTIDVLRESFGGNLDFGLIGYLYEITELSFEDLKPADWSYKFVLKAYGEGLIAGTSDKTFSPKGNLTHAQALVMACAMNASYEGVSIDKTVAEGGAWYDPFLTYGKAHGITDGTFDEKMNEPVTRAEMAYYFANALPAEKYVATSDVEMKDIAESEYAESINSLAKSGIVTGYGEGEFRPDNQITREEAAVILANMFDLAAK